MGAVNRHQNLAFHFLVVVALFNAGGVIAQVVEGYELRAIAQLSISAVCLYMAFTFMPREQ